MNTLEVQLAYLIDFALYYTLFYFLAFHLVLHYIRITFFVNIFLLGCVPPAGRMLQAVGGLEIYYKLEVLCAFKVNLAPFIYLLIYGK